MKATIEAIKFIEMDMICLCAGGYKAIVCPDMGCNCVSLEHMESGASLLRTPESGERFRKAPNVFGTPLLFPPNRVKDGTFVFEGRRYELPVNEISKNNHIHGVLSATKFDIVTAEADEDEATLVCEYRATAGKPYLTFPHAFTVRHETRLDFEGLHQAVTVTNDSDCTMPLGVGFHTTLRAPALADAAEEDQRLTLTAGRKWCYDDRIIPTGETTEDDPVLRALKGEGVVPCREPISIHCEQTGGCAVLRDVKRRCATLYRISDSFRYWMIWNGNSKDRFICPEPQTNMVDFVNRPFGDDVTGLIALKSGESHTVRTNLSFVRQ